MSTMHAFGTCATVLGLTLMARSSISERSPLTAVIHQEPQKKPRAGHQNRVEGVEKEVKAFIAHYIETLEGGDEKAIRDLFVADERFAWFTDGAKSYATADDVLAGMRRYAGIKFQTTVSEVRVVPLSATLASARSKFKTRLTIPFADDHEYGGVITWLIEKASPSGQWRVLLGHTSTPGGPPKRGEERKKQNKR